MPSPVRLLPLRGALCLLVLLLAGCSVSRRAVSVANPMPLFRPGARVLFQGDSITDGNRGRSSDPNHILGHGYAFALAARFGEELAERRLVFLNRGVSGDTVTNLVRRWKTDTLDLRPDVLSILIGINDLFRGVGVEEYERSLDALLAETRAALPGVTLVLGEPFGLPVGHFAQDWPRHAADLAERRAVVARLAVKHRAVRVPYQQAFDAALRRAPAEYWIWDGIHPTYAGHQVMAEAWVQAVRSAVPESRR